uniref:HSF-type DNA-binding domain-containing protein n=1 Tax=Kalmanozyma brasiliensis (strain GHG001) TaxID=1365824 RepID=V5EV77_KALBG
MNGIENGQSFDPAFDAFFQAPPSSSPNQPLQHLGSDSPATLAHLGKLNATDPASSLSVFGHDVSNMQNSSAGNNLHLNISGLSVKSEGEQQQHLQQLQQQQLLQQQQQQQRQQQHQSNSLNFANVHASSPQSQLTSPADASSFSIPGASATSPLLHPDASSSSILDANLGAPAASSPLRTEYNLSNETGAVMSADMRSYSSASFKSAVSQNVNSPTNGFNGVGDQSIGDTSIDDSNVTRESDVDLAAEKRQSSKFVYKLFRMVSDPDYQHLISWNRNGTSVMVCNFDEFAKEVLGKHFKHSNFSSFIRQLNMYGFYKVNKTPRGHRQSVDAQIWEFSHPKFLRGRPDLLDDIRRKALDSEHARVEARDLQYSVSVGQMQLRQQVDEMQFRIEELTEQNMALRTFTTQLRDVLGMVLDHVKKASGGNVGFDVRVPTLDLPSPMPPQGLWTPQGHDGPPIFVTEPEFGAGAGQSGLRSMMGGSPYFTNNGFPQFGHNNLTMADQSFFGPDGSEGPNAKAMRTPLKRTASNSGPSGQGTPVLIQATSPGLAKRKSPL